MVLKTIDPNDALGVALMEGPRGIRIVSVTLDIEGLTGYYNGMSIKDFPVERIVDMFPASADLIYAYCGTQDYEI